MADSSVDILLDYRGAAWHYVIELGRAGDISHLSALFTEYDRVLKPGGAVVTDEETVLKLRENGVKFDSFKFGTLESRDSNQAFAMGIARKVDKGRENS